MTLTKEDILKISFDTIQNFNNVQKISGVSIDSRTISDDQIFFAIKGDAFDGHDYIKDVFKKGAALAVVNKKWFKKNSGKYSDKCLVVVDDTIIAMGQLAASFRAKFHKPVLALTGSNGKTTTKEMIYSVLSQKYKVLRTEGNLNNHIGVPLMMFKLDEKFDFAVIEMGTNHFGEIKYLCDIAQPDFGLITNIGHAHLEFFKDLNGVRKAKGELFDYLEKGEKTAYINGDDINISKLSKRLKNKITYGFNRNYRYTAEFLGLDKDSHGNFILQLNKDNNLLIELNIVGKHNVYNALAAAVVGMDFFVSPKNIQKALRSFTPSSKRMELVDIQGIKILNDCYNSNPDSVRVALESFGSYKVSGNKIVILGDMLELGKQKDVEHRNIGKLILEHGFETVLLYGPLSKNTFTALKNKINIIGHYKNKIDLVKRLKDIVKKGDAILIKGSRGMKMETIIQDIKNF
jgi:UDP-N-acetylmuramoyl-tripeptide--D-alanyl-D-alanine ligase